MGTGPSTSKFSQETYLYHNGRELVQKWAGVWIQTTTHKLTFPYKTSVTRQSSLEHIKQISSGKPALGAILLKHNAQHTTSTDRAKPTITVEAGTDKPSNSTSSNSNEI